ncbi:MAG: YdeI/OmpD-associated family protein [Bacteroidota bacterium]|nr:YdeI/OmpD-associated family protein [Bacteroidota bacterium]
MKQLHADSIGAWRSWLQKNHDSETVVWLVFRKKGAGPVPFGYQEALDEALCMGWVDSLLKKIDEVSYVRKFTPRKASSTWSDRNKVRVEQLILEGRMMPPGMKTIEVARESGMWDKGVKPPEVDESLPGALLSAFQNNPLARDHYFGMPDRAQKQFNIWINMAKRPETVSKRLDESIRLLEKGEELGLK